MDWGIVPQWLPTANAGTHAWNWRTAPQWITAFIAFVAGAIAVWSIVSQRSIARKRAPVDVFIKTEMDEKMIVAYDRFHTGLNEMRKANLIRRGLDGTLVRP
jgi:anti-sigma-K factor RskA